MSNDLTFVDLFAGAGGMSLGLELAGLRRLFSVELSPMAAETYFRNLIDPDEARWNDHVNAPIEEQIRSGLVVSATSEVLARPQLLPDPREVDLLVGGPPCQGFSLAGLRNHADRRNRLPFEFLDFVKLLMPRYVILENVPGIAALFDRSVDGSVGAQLVEALRRLGYVPRLLRIDASRFGVAQARNRILIVAGRADAIAPDFVQSVERWSEGSTVRVSAHSAIGDIIGPEYLYDARRSYPESLKAAATLRFDTKLVPAALADVRPPSLPPNHDERCHSEVVTSRFGLLRALFDSGVDPKLLERAATTDSTTAKALVEDAFDEARDRLTFPMFAYGNPVAASAQELTDLVLRLASKKHSQRLIRSSMPSPTLLSLPDDHVHWAAPRTLTVREMARLQSFPDAFVFRSKVTTGGTARRTEVPQYTQVGNAVPPFVARSIGKHLLSLDSFAPADQVDSSEPLLVA